MKPYTSIELGSICELIMGQSPSSTTYNSDGIGLPFFQGNADFGEEHPSPSTWCTAPKKTAEKGDILISVRAPIGAINTADESCCIGRGIAAIRPDGSRLNASFLKYFLISRRGELERAGTGSTFTAIGKRVLSKLQVRLYNVDDQLEISKRLDALSEGIRLARRQLNQLDLLVKSRFIEMFGLDGTSVVNWTSLGNLISSGPQNGLYKPQSYYGDGIKIVRIDSFDYEGNWTKSLKRLGCSPEEIAKYGLDDCDFLINRVNSIGHMGKSILFRQKGSSSVVFESNMMRFHVDNSRINEVFLSFVLRDERSKAYFERKAKPSVNQASINQKDVCSLEVPLPDLRIQEEFASFAEQIDKLRFDVQQQIEKLETLKKSLMQEYFGNNYVTV